MKQIITILILSLLFPFISNAQQTHYNAHKTLNMPVFDGDTNDYCWKSAAWQSISNIWIPYNNILPSSFLTESGTKVVSGDADFKARYKILWSETNNELLFLCEVHDDSIIDNYTGGNGYSNYDVLELFIDEDKSGGNHLFSDGSNNGQNAFAYHILVNRPSSGFVNYMVSAVDLSGSSWGNFNIENYANHFPHFAYRETNRGVYVYEFSLKVYNDSFDPIIPSTSSITQLYENKEIGFTLAYCDNDEEDGKRNHFIGSATVSGANNNESYINASLFGGLKLIGSKTDIAPSAPVIANITTLSGQRIKLSWSAAQSSVPLAYYKVFKNDTLLSTLTGLSLTVSGLNRKIDNKFNVIAIDSNGLESMASNSKIYPKLKPFLKLIPSSITGFSTQNYTITAISEGIQSPISISGNGLNYIEYEFSNKIYLNTFQPKFERDTNLLIFEFGRPDILVCIDEIGTFTGNTLFISNEFDTIKLSYKIYHDYSCGSNTVIKNEFSKIKIFPNPASDYIQIEGEFQKMILKNVLGVEMNANFNNNTVDMSNLPKGIYFLEIINNSKSNIYKIFKE